MIPAAGLGTRFLPVTKAVPKELLPLYDKPLIQYAVEEAVGSGIEEIVLVIRRGRNRWRSIFGRTRNWSNRYGGRSRRNCWKRWSDWVRWLG